MRLLGFEISRSKPASAQRKPRRSMVSARAFAAAKQDNLTATFTGSHLSINEELRRSLPLLQRRSRDVCENVDYARRFIKMLEKNVVGPNGITLQAQFTQPDGSPDLLDRRFVEGHWRQWSKKRNCSVDRQLSWLAIQSLVIKTVARDGEVLIEKIRNRGGDYMTRLRVMECDHLDVDHNEKLGNGRRIVMGIELDRNDAPVAYWLTDRHPGDHGVMGYAGMKRRRVPAENILHIFVTERPGQLRGFPWMHSAIRRLNMLAGYEEAELVAARIGASKMGFYTSPDGAGNASVTDMASDGVEGDDYDLVDEVEPGTFHQLPEGVGFTTFDPQHPTAAFPDFNKAMLRGAASGFDVSYETLSNNREDVNFSSIRTGTIDERDSYRVIQRWLIDALHEEIYSHWLADEIDFGQLNSLPAEKIATKFSNVAWMPRAWDWVDPLKDIKATVEEYKLGTTSLTEIAARRGRDLEDVFMQRQADDALAAKYGQSVGQLLADMTDETDRSEGETHDET